MSDAYESAQDWNRRYPPGTPVRIDLRGGGSLVATTAGYAQQWGALALVRLHDTESEAPALQYASYQY